MIQDAVRHLHPAAVRDQDGLHLEADSRILERHRREAHVLHPAGHAAEHIVKVFVGIRPLRSATFGQVERRGETDCKVIAP